MDLAKQNKRAPRNRTLVLSPADRNRFSRQLRLTSSLQGWEQPEKKTIAAERMVQAVHGDYVQWLPTLANSSVDLLFLDPPYNLSKSFNGHRFSKRPEGDYSRWLTEVLQRLLPYLKPTASVYICGDWRTSHSIYEAAARVLRIRNRITWEREKGRGARRNWKNNSEDIWFCTVSNDFYFNPDAVKTRRRVLAPYTDAGGPKDWRPSSQGNYRDTYPSNLWTEISVPFWSMPENTDHPTQKSEKLMAKLLLASTRPGDFVLDPFSGSGTTLVVCKKLGRRGLGIEIEQEYCLWALHRLELCTAGSTIQGYEDGVFWERNTRIPKKD